MNPLSWISSGLSMLFGSSSNGRGAVGAISDTVDRWNPSAQTKQKNSIEDLKAGDESQNSARAMVIPHHDSWFDVLVDGMNRSVRPFITYWVMGVLFKWWEAPNTETIDPIILNIMWTVITFWFGSRVIFKDVPNAVAKFSEMKAAFTAKKAQQRRDKLATPSAFEED